MVCLLCLCIVITQSLLYDYLVFMLLFHAYDSIMFIFLHIIMMRMEGTGTRDGRGKQRADAL